MEQANVEKKKMGTGCKVAVGCGSGCLVVVLLAALGIGVGAYYIKKTIAKYETELKGYGFEKVTQGQVIDVTNPVDEPVLFKGQVVRIMADCSTNIAVLAQACEIYGKIDGKVYFRGQVLTVQPNAEIHGGIDAKAQVIQNHGTIEGPVSGSYQVFEDKTAHNEEPAQE